MLILTYLGKLGSVPKSPKTNNPTEIDRKRYPFGSRQEKTNSMSFRGCNACDVTSPMSSKTESKRVIVIIINITHILQPFKVAKPKFNALKSSINKAMNEFKKYEKFESKNLNKYIKNIERDYSQKLKDLEAQYLHDKKQLQAQQKYQFYFPLPFKSKEKISTVRKKQ